MPARAVAGGWNDGLDGRHGHAGRADHLVSARGGDAAAFERLVAGYRNELYAHCYRMLGSVQDAEDALQESLLGAWRGLAGFEGRSSLRAAGVRHALAAGADPGERAAGLRLLPGRDEQ